MLVYAVVLILVMLATLRRSTSALTSGGLTAVDIQPHHRAHGIARLIGERCEQTTVFNLLTKCGSIMTASHVSEHPPV